MVQLLKILIEKMPVVAETEQATLNRVFSIEENKFKRKNHIEILKFLSLMFLFNLIFISANAQIPNWQWAKSINGNRDDYGMSIATDNNSNVVMVGYFQSDSITNGNTSLHNSEPWNSIFQPVVSDIFVSKYDSSGNVLWTKTFAGDSNEVANAVAIDKDNNIIVVGKFSGDSLQVGSTWLTKPSTQVSTDAFIFKLDPNGNAIWAKSIGSTGTEEGKVVCTDEKNNIYMGGTFWSSAMVNFGVNSFSSIGEDDIFITKYTSSGTPVWTKVYGSTISENISDICSDNTGHIYFTGEYRSSNLTIGSLLPANFESAPTTEIYLAKMDESGNIIWNNTANCIGADYVNGIAVNKNKNVMITGRFAEYYLVIDGDTLIGDHSNNPGCINGAGFYLIQFDSNGVYKWVQTIKKNNGEVGLSVATDKDDNILVSAWAIGDTLAIDSITIYNLPTSALLLLKYNTSGHILWQKTFGIGDHQGWENTKADIVISKANILYLGSSFMKPSISLDALTLTNPASLPNIEPYLAKLGVSNNTLAINEIANNLNCIIYPVPTTNYINVEMQDKLENYHIYLYNSQGQIFFELKNQKGSSSIDLSFATNGIYYLAIQSSKGNKIQKVIINR